MAGSDAAECGRHYSSLCSFHLQVASPGFPALEELSVAGNAVDGFCSTPVMDDNAVERIVKSSHKLKLLDVRGCSRVSDSSLVRVPAWDLEHLFLSGKFCSYH
jgi:F-box/leucine-rich repeat protein 6